MGSAASTRGHHRQPASCLNVTSDDPLEKWGVERVAESLERDEQLAPLAPYARAHAIDGNAALSLGEMKLEEILDDLPCYAVPRDVVDAIEDAASRGARGKKTVETNDKVRQRLQVTVAEKLPPMAAIAPAALASKAKENDLLRDTPTGSIWRCQTGDERREWVERNKRKIGKSATGSQISVERLAIAITNSAFIPEKLVAMSRNELKEKLKTVDDSIVSGQILNFLDMLRKQEGHSLYRAQRNSSGRFKSFIFETWLGNGGFGEVYKVRDRHDGHLYALNIGALNNEAMLEFGLKNVLKQDDAVEEAKLLSKIKSEFLLSVHEYRLEASELVWSRIELSQHGSLAARLGSSIINARGRVDEHVAWKWMVNCVSGLEYLHREGIMHNDIKPEVHPPRRICLIQLCHFPPSSSLP